MSWIKFCCSCNHLFFFQQALLEFPRALMKTRLLRRYAKILLKLYEVKSMVHQYSMLLMLGTNSFLYVFFNFKNIVFTSSYINSVSWLIEGLFILCREETLTIAARAVFTYMCDTEVYYTLEFQFFSMIAFDKRISDSFW